PGFQRPRSDPVIARFLHEVKKSRVSAGVSEGRLAAELLCLAWRTMVAIRLPVLLLLRCKVKVHCAQARCGASHTGLRGRLRCGEGRSQKKCRNCCHRDV